MQNPIRQAYYSEDGIDLPDTIVCECGADMVLHDNEKDWVCTKNPQPEEGEDWDEDKNYCEYIDVDVWAENKIDSWDSDTHMEG